MDESRENINRIISGQEVIPMDEMIKWTVFSKRAPRDITDDILCNHITRNFNLFVMGGVIWYYTGGRYKPDSTGVVIKTLIRKHIPQEIRKDPIIGRIHRLLLSDATLATTYEEVNAYPSYWINTKSGMFDPVSWRSFPHNPAYKSINQIPHEFTGVKPPANHGKNVKAFMREAISEEDRQTILEFTGLSCSADVRFQKSICLQGQGATGKSSLLNLITATIGAENISSVPLQKIEQRFYPVQLLGKTANICSDLPSERMPFVGNFKAAVCGESINDSYKSKDQFSFCPYAKMLFSANELPPVSDKSDGFYRRLIVIGMNTKPKKTDPDLLQKMTAPDEIDFFLYWSIAAYRQALKQGFITESQAAKDAVEAYRQANDPIEAYMSECWMESENKTDRVNRKTLYDEYVDFCNELGAQALIAKNFYETLRQKGYRRADINGQRCFGYLVRKPPKLATEDATEAELLAEAAILFPEN